MEAVQNVKASMVISDEEKHVPQLRRLKNKPDLKIRKVSFESQESTNESQLSEDQAPLSPCSKLNRDLGQDYGASIEKYLKAQEKDNKLSDDHLEGHELKANFRARMVDWMCEVLNIAFSNICSD